MIFLNENKPVSADQIDFFAILYAVFAIPCIAELFSAFIVAAVHKAAYEFISFSCSHGGCAALFLTQVIKTPLKLGCPVYGNAFLFIFRNQCCLSLHARHSWRETVGIEPTIAFLSAIPLVLQTRRGTSPLPPIQV